MGDNSASNLVFLIVSLTVAASIGGMAIKYSQRISSSIKREGSDLAQQIRTDVSITNDPEYMLEESQGENKLVLYVKNTGSTVLENSAKVISVFVDGVYLSEDNINNFPVMGNEEWIPNSTAKITTDYTENYLGSGEHKARVEVFKNEDSLSFYLEG